MRYPRTAAERERLEQAVGQLCPGCGADAHLVDQARDGQVRGLLCSSCRAAVHAVDAPDILRALAAYLTDPPARGMVDEPPLELPEGVFHDGQGGFIAKVGSTRIPRLGSFEHPDDAQRARDEWLLERSLPRRA